jgi:ribokinase
MRILNIGSINIDHVYAVSHFVRPGETLDSSRYEVFAGGKGFNQSIALARAGASVRHVGMVGRDGAWLLDRLAREGVDITHVEVTEVATGHAIIQIVPTGENAIVLYGGANRKVSRSTIESALSSSSPGEYLLVQNETNAVVEAIRRGSEHGMRVVFNPAPMAQAVRDYPLECVDVFILNETEAESLTGKTALEDVRIAMCRRFPRAATVLTLGSRGAVYFDATSLIHQAAIAVQAVDTTAAGDTFIGYFLAELVRKGDPASALSLGCRAAAICVTRAGASASIPFRSELESLQPDPPAHADGPRH